CITHVPRAGRGLGVGAPGDGVWVPTYGLPGALSGVTGTRWPARSCWPPHGRARREPHPRPKDEPTNAYSTRIVPFWPSASRGDLGSRPTRLVAKAYRPGVSEQAVRYRPGGEVAVRR